MIIDKRPSRIVIEDGQIFIQVDERPFWRRWLSAAVFWRRK